ncbi:hypothetical protein HAX54_038605 [Datura stramonium]|uniref:FBD domain-containing protein n=1 Tax=Datura stramonium TaxID=4076 RepID=A0ABS8VLC3_DATST|nr:hypothetical protein [Datura stramonium]
MASLVTTVLYFDFDFEDGDELMESGCLTELLHSIATCRRILNWVPELSDLETLIIDGCNLASKNSFVQHLLSNYTSEDRQIKRFMTHNFNFSLLHLKTIKVINFDGPLSGNKFVVPLVKYLLNNAIVLEKFCHCCKFEGSDVSQDYGVLLTEEGTDLDVAPVIESIPLHVSQVTAVTSPPSQSPRILDSSGVCTANPAFS